MLISLVQIWAVAALGWLGPTADLRGLIDKALAEPTQITLDNLSLEQAIAVITEQTGVRLEMRSDAMRLAPNGPQTVIQRVNIANIPLREGLTRLFGPLGMTFVVADDHVQIVPKEALLCLGRPATWQELETLSEISGLKPGQSPEQLSQLQKHIQFQVPIPDAWGVLAPTIRNVGAGPGDEVLTVACNHLGWAWCPSGKHVVVGTFDQMLRRRLQQPISLRMNNRPLFEVMQAVGAAVHIPVRVEPGSLASLPPQTQKNFSLNVHLQSVEEVLDTISAVTTLGYMINPDGVLFYRPDRNLAAQVEPATVSPQTVQAAPDPYVAKISIQLSDGRTFEWLIRRSELPDDLRQMRDRDIQDFIEEFRQKRTADGH